MHKTLGIRDGQRQCTKSKHKKTRTLKEREKLVTIIGGASQKSASKCVSGKRESESEGASECGERRG
jgi:hypothetical protein